MLPRKHITEGNRSGKFLNYLNEKLISETKSKFQSLTCWRRTENAGGSLQETQVNNFYNHSSDSNAFRNCCLIALEEKHALCTHKSLKETSM